MGKRTRTFLNYFSVLFIINLLVNFFFKDNIHLVTAFSVALGFSLGVVYLPSYLSKRI